MTKQKHLDSRDDVPENVLFFPSHLTVWLPPGDTGTRMQCSVASFHPSPLPIAFRRPEWLDKGGILKIGTVTHILLF